MIDTLNQIVEDGLKRKLVHNYSSIDFEPPNSLIVVDDHEMVNFGSCSYLGLEKHSDLQNGVVDAVKKYGTQFASSRTYISHGLYHELENLIYQIFHKPLIVTASTTLGHLATIPVVVEKNDAIILDLQVHSSIQMTVQQLKARGLPVSIIKHNCMESLESKIQSLYNKHDQIWYFADGVYSMYGDYAPFEQLDKLLLKYEKFNLYIDDAHGMGWDGKNGCGVVFKNMKQIEKMILTVSLNKSFAAAGGCVVFPNKEIEKKVRNCGSTYIFAGPIQPPMLGAAISSAKLHLSEKIESMQANLMELINYTNVRLDELGLPQFQKTHSPLFFIPVGPPKICCDIVSKMKSKGFFMNIASFPAVPIRRSGIRFMINAFLKKKQINEMLTALCGIYSETITENNTTCTQISKTFKIPDFSLNADQNHVKNSSEEKLQTKIYRSIKNLDEKEWDDIFQKNSTLNYANVALIEDVYTNENRLENNWDFYYIDIKDSNDNIILKTLITVVLTKDDMLHSNTVSRKVEALRSDNNPYYLTSKTILTGTLITKGNHVYIDYRSKHWKKALLIFIDYLNKILDESGASKIMIRDFYDTQNAEFETSMLENGFTRFQLPNNMEIENLIWKDTDEYLKSLSQKYRYNVRKEIIKYESNFITSFEKIDHKEELLEVYNLYEKVYEKSYDFNVFKLPLEYFKKICTSSEYDIIRLYLKNEVLEEKNIESDVLVGAMFSKKNKDIYNAMIVGLNYDYVYSHNCYKQILYKTLLRARELNCKKLDLAFTAELEKKKIGARPKKVFAYVQSTEHLKGSILEFM